MAKKVTNEKLARMMQNQFSKLNKKIDKVDNKVDNKFDGLETKVDDLKYEFNHLKMKVYDIDYKLDKSLAKQDTQNTQLKDHEKRVVIVEKKLERV